MCAAFSDDDLGKRVVNERGEEVGIVTAVEHGTAHVEPDPGITDTIKAKLGWQDTDEDAYPLQEAAVARVTDDEIRLEGDLGATGGSATAAGAGTDRGTDVTGDTDTTTRDTSVRDEGGITDDDDELIGDDDGDLLGDDTGRGDDELIGDDDDDDELIGDDDDDDLLGDDTR